MPRDPAPTAQAQPQLCMGQVRHARLRPRVHAFSYGIFYLRLPLRSMGMRDFPARLISRNRANVLAFRDSDHGDGSTPLLDWIDALLRQHGVLDADGEIWLQTMPRMFAYVFNPVSFWFCHRLDGALRAVVCDVRNTFGERHLYLLEEGGSIAYGSELVAKKIFHVSPFCKVEGQYRFRFLRNSEQDRERHLARIDYDDLDGLVLQTSLSGTAQPLRDGAIAWALLRYPLMTFGVMARIHWQALRLWLRRVPFFSKPHPPQEKVSR
ncbi:DUF1365 domain-containing protein [Janthinobacterium sp. UMAB-56]|uniref:DUF1365 domain-containing protein n=1 Tax=Janthinobacterium sp. UMAB-56 TaxID=1365361 RepID=UPI001C598C97|nr:DUF1365 domain-containing protein [Janthinobacterium sp. UMAB-56]